MATSLTARVPEDLLALTPVVLGFRPSDSLVMLTFDADRSFHARVDLPPPEMLADSLPELVGLLLEPAIAQRVGRVAFISYSGDGASSARIVQALRQGFVAHGIDVFALLRAHDGQWCHLPPAMGDRESEPTPYDDSAHPFAARAVLEGLVTHASREDLRATIAPVPKDVARVVELQSGAGFRAADREWALDLVAGCVAAGRRPGDEDAARLLAGMTRWEVRDAALFAVTRELAPRQLEIWTDLLRRAPEAQVPDTAAVTAFYAWQAGHGALAWCALDRCMAVDPGHRLGRHLGECLTRAIPPTAWEEMSRSRRARRRARTGGGTGHGDGP